MRWQFNLKHSEYIQVLSEKDFRNVWLAAIISDFGDVLHDIAVLWLVLTITKSAVAVSSLIIVGTLPTIIFGLLGGSLADQFNRRRLMVIMDLGRAFVVILLPLLYQLGFTSLLLILCIAFIREALSLLFYPAQQSIIPQLVPSNLLTAANSLNQTIMFLTSSLAPLLAGVIIAVFNPYVAFYIDVVTFLISALLLTQLRYTSNDILVTVKK